MGWGGGVFPHRCPADSCRNECLRLHCAARTACQFCTPAGPGEPDSAGGVGGGGRFKSNRQCLNRFNTARVAAVIVALSLYLLMGAASVAAVMPPTHEHGRHAAAEAPGAASMAEGRPPRSGRRTRRENRKCWDITEDQRLPPFKARR